MTCGHKWEKSTLKITDKSKHFTHPNKSISKLFLLSLERGACQQTLVIWGLYPLQGPLFTAGSFSLLRSPKAKSFGIL